MSMPQVHIVAYCSDLGYGAARGAEMLSLMLGCGIVSRLTFGVICDRIGGLRTLLVGSALQGLSLLLFLPFDSLASLYVISALFGLFQGGLVPSYAIIVREYFSPQEAGARVGTVIMASGRFVPYLALYFTSVLVAGIIMVHGPEGWFVVGGGRNGMEFSVSLIIALLVTAYADRDLRNRPAR